MESLLDAIFPILPLQRTMNHSFLNISFLSKPLGSSTISLALEELLLTRRGPVSELVVELSDSKNLESPKSATFAFP